MERWELQFQWGCYYLSKHKIQRSIKAFRQAADHCPASKPEMLSRILYFLGISLERSGQSSLAIQSWINARRLVHRGFIVKSYPRWINEYGMRRTNNSEVDDYYAFATIQVSRYLSNRTSHCFYSREEQDMVVNVIQDTWKLLEKSKILLSLSVDKKIELFKRARLDFPYICREESFTYYAKPSLDTFKKDESIANSEGFCSCGSGLPRRMCCGRIRVSN